MKLIILAFILSMALHILLFFFPYKREIKNITTINKSKKANKTNVHFVSLKPKIIPKNIA